LFVFGGRGGHTISEGSATSSATYLSFKKASVLLPRTEYYLFLNNYSVNIKYHMPNLLRFQAYDTMGAIEFH
jgi:hypothetical protein